MVRFIRGEVLIASPKEAEKGGRFERGKMEKERNCVPEATL